MPKTIKAAIVTKDACVTIRIQKRVRDNMHVYVCRYN